MSRVSVRMQIVRDGVPREVDVHFDTYVMDRGDGVVRRYYDLEPRPAVEITDDELDLARALARSSESGRREG